MNWDKAVTALKAGKKIKRRSWVNTKWITGYDNRDIYLDHDYCLVDVGDQKKENDWVCVRTLYQWAHLLPGDEHPAITRCFYENEEVLRTQYKCHVEWVKRLDYTAIEVEFEP
jgi:hypothetical protein